MQRTASRSWVRIVLVAGVSHGSWQLAEVPDCPQTGPNAFSRRDEPEGNEGEDNDWNERAELGAQGIAGLVEAPALDRHLLTDFLSPALSHFPGAP